MTDKQSVQSTLSRLLYVPAMLALLKAVALLRGGVSEANVG